MNFSRVKSGFLLAVAVAVYAGVLLINDGFMALDEYWVGITRYIPAQTSSVATLVGPDDVKSPLQLLPMHAVAQAAHALGVESPYWQYRSVIFVLGSISVLLLFFAVREFSEVMRLSEDERKFLLLIFIFYFAMPFAMTRPMFESLAAPWLTLAAVKALRYDHESLLKDLLLGVLFVSVAFILRQQLGFCALALIALPLMKKNVRHLLAAGGLGLSFFVLSGIPDYFLRGRFHFSLLNLTVYNYQHGSEYGDRSILFYPVLIIIVAFVPFFVRRYPAGFVAEQFKKQRTVLMMLGLFIFLHSLFPQKWERFVISVLPLLVFVLFPFLVFLQRNFSQNKIRLGLLYALNGGLFVVASFFPAQKNLIEMSRYLADHPEIKKIYRVHDTPGWITEAFILNKQFQFVEADQLPLSEKTWDDCSEAFVVGEAQADEQRAVTDKLTLNAQFDVNLIEQLAFKSNPKNNLRRVKLRLYSGCQR